MKTQGMRRSYYTLEFKREVVQAYLESKLSRKAIAHRYGVTDATSISQWLRIFKGEKQRKKRKVPFSITITRSHMKTQKELQLEEELYRLARQLEKKEKELEKARLEALAYQTMIEVAEEELQIQIRKKSGPKQ